MYIFYFELGLGCLWWASSKAAMAPTAVQITMSCSEVGICIPGVSSLGSIEDPCFGIKGSSASIKLYAWHEAASVLD